MRLLIIILCLCTCTSAAHAGTVQELTLAQLLDSARQNNNALRAARHDIEAARQQRKEVFTKFFPKISATGLWFNANKGMAATTIDPSEFITPEMGAVMAQMLPAEALAAMSSPMTMSMMKNGLIGSVTAVQPVFTGGRIVNGHRLARVGEDVRQLQLQLSEQEVETATEDYFWKLASMHEKQRTIAAVEALLADIHKDVDVAVRAGVAMRNDLLQVELRQSEIASQKLKLQNGIELVNMLLAQHCGLVDSFQLAVPAMEQATAAMPLPADHDASLHTLPEYRLLEKQVEVARLQKQMAVGENLPSVAVGAGYVYHDILDNDRSFGMVFATVSVPLSDWWGGSHAIKRRNIEHKKAQEQLTDNAEKLAIRMRAAWNAVEESFQQLILAESSIQQAEENLRINRNYYRAGTSRMADLLEAQMLYQQTLDRRTDAFAEHQRSILAYRHASGQQALYN